MTKKLYYNNAYLYAFVADILDIVKKDESYHIVLNETAFYPEGGGQPCDTGLIGGQEVKYVYEENGEIYHVVEKCPNSNKRVCGEINWAKRFDLMQQHLGQHILSAILLNFFHANTIGLRFGNDEMQIDLDKYINNEELAIAEAFSNEVIYNNLQVEILYPSFEEVLLYSKRKIPQNNGEIRIIKIEGVDYTPCCGTHNRMTGEVGIIKILRVEKHKTGSRIIFLCGKRALNLYKRISELINGLKKELEVNDIELIDKVKKLRSEGSDLKDINKNLRNRLIESDISRLKEKFHLIGDYKVIAHVFNNQDSEYIKGICTSMLAEDKTITLFGLNNQTNVQLFFGTNKNEKEVDIRDVFNQSLHLINGKGGGSKNYAQGIGNETEKIEQAIDVALLNITLMIKN